MAQQQFLRDQAGLDRRAQADVISQQQVDPGGVDRTSAEVTAVQRTASTVSPRRSTLCRATTMARPAGSTSLTTHCWPRTDTNAPVVGHSAVELVTVVLLGSTKWLGSVAGWLRWTRRVTVRCGLGLTRSRGVPCSAELRRPATGTSAPSVLLGAGWRCLPIIAHPPSRDMGVLPLLEYVLFDVVLAQMFMRRKVVRVAE